MRRSGRKIARRFLSDGKKQKKSKSSEPFISALKKREGEGLKDSTASDLDFGIQSQMLKSYSNRFTLRFKKRSNPNPNPNPNLNPNPDPNPYPNPNPNPNPNQSDRDMLGEDGDNDEVMRSKKDDEKAPQHRRYLSFPRAGNASGSPTERAARNDTMRMQRGATITHKYQMEKLGFLDQEGDERDLTLGGTNEVEDKITLSMLQGDFDNLEGEGKPREEASNSLLDSTTDIGYNILAKHGIVPDFVQSQKVMNGHKQVKP